MDVSWIPGVVIEFDKPYMNEVVSIEFGRTYANEVVSILENA